MIWLLIGLGIKKLNPIVADLLIISRKLNISLVFITQSYFPVPKNIGLHSTHYFILKIPKKWELQWITFNHSSDKDFQDFMNVCKKCTTELSSFLFTDATLASDNPWYFRKSLV